MNITSRLLKKSNLFCSVQRYFVTNKYPNLATEEIKNKTHFGYENVSPEEKAEKVHNVFENVAETYDLMNDVMSGGIHRIWKDCFVHRLGPTPGSKFLDVAGGTGDITFRIIQHIKQHSAYEKNKELEKPNFHVTVCDISQGMLDVGKSRSETLGHTNIDWICGDAMDLPFPDDHFDCYTIAYGMRNVVDVDKALQEAYRVLKPGGRFLCLEFSNVNNMAVKWLYDQYSFQVIPVMGKVIANDWKSYQYLVESIRKFPTQNEYKEMIEDAGFRSVRYENLTFGVTAIHSGFKI